MRKQLRTAQYHVGCQTFQNLCTHELCRGLIYAGTVTMPSGTLRQTIMYGIDQNKDSQADERHYATCASAYWRCTFRAGTCTPGTVCRRNVYFRFRVCVLITSQHTTIQTIWNMIIKIYFKTIFLYFYIMNTHLSYLMCVFDIIRMPDNCCAILKCISV